MRRQKHQQKRIKFVDALIQGKECSDYGAGRLKFFIKKVVSFALKHVSFAQLQRLAEREMCRYNNGEQEYLVSMASHYSYKKQLMSADIYGTPRKIFFEGEAFFAPEKTEKYLTQLFGDYMKLPPEDERYVYLNHVLSVNYGRYGKNEGET